MTQLLSDRPIEEIPFIEVDVAVDINLSSDQKQQWHGEVNKFFHGSARVPLDVTLSQEHKDAAWHVACGRRTTIKMRLYADGSVAFVPQQMRLTRSTALASSDELLAARPKLRTINENFPIPFKSDT